MRLLLLFSIWRVFICYIFSIFQVTCTYFLYFNLLAQNRLLANADRPVQIISIKCLGEIHLLHAYRNKRQAKQKSGVELSTARPTANLPSSNRFESQETKMLGKTAHQPQNHLKLSFIKWVTAFAGRYVAEADVIQQLPCCCCGQGREIPPWTQWPISTHSTGGR